LQLWNKEREMCNIISKTLFYYQKEMKYFYILYKMIKNEIK